MKIRTVLPLLLAVAPLMAGGEYDRFHFGFRLGAAWAPDKSYGSLGSQPPGTDEVAATPMQFAGVFGLHAQYAAIPGKLSLNLIVDGLDTIHKETGDTTGTGGKVNQTNVRGEFRLAFADRGNQNENFSFWVSPTYNLVATSNDLYSLHEHRMGGALGIMGTSFDESHKSYWEVGVYSLPKFKSGTSAGKFSLEFKWGWLF